MQVKDFPFHCVILTISSSRIFTYTTYIHYIYHHTTSLLVTFTTLQSAALIFYWLHLQLLHFYLYINTMLPVLVLNFFTYLLLDIFAKRRTRRFYPVCARDRKHDKRSLRGGSSRVSYDLDGPSLTLWTLDVLI